jgi:hypothetical protein
MLRRNSWIHILLPVLLLAILTLTSQQSQAGLAPILDTSPSGWVVQTVTHEGRVRVTITKTKAKLHLPKTQRPVIKLSVEDDDSDYYDELPDLQIGYRRPELINQTADVHDDISDEIKIRLLLARKRAMQAYHAKWS